MELGKIILSHLFFIVIQFEEFFEIIGHGAIREI
jgi:hypothetical protein